MLELCNDKTPLSLDTSREAGVRIAAQIAAYGLSQPFFLVYKGEGGSVLSVLDGAATLLSGDDADEALCFVAMSPQITSLRTDGETATAFAAARGLAARTGNVLKAPQNILPTGSAKAIAPADYYPLAKRVFGESMPPFDAWYADVTHRVRRDKCRLVAVCDEKTPVSGGMTVAEAETAWLLGAICTDPAYRQRGYAAACVTALASAGQAQGKDVYIAAKNEAAQRLYESLGFTVCGTWSQVDFK